MHFAQTHSKKIIVVSILSIILFSACENAAIFSAIDKEIKLKEPVVKGNVTHMSLLGDYATGTLFTTNGTLFYKKADSASDWSAFSKQQANTRAVATDNDTLYIMTQEEGKLGNVYACTTPTTSPSELTLIASDIIALFNNKAVTSANKKAYITKSTATGKYTTYTLDGTTLISTLAVAKVESDKRYISAVYKDTGGDIFSESRILCGNDDGTKFYQNSDKKIQYSVDGITWETTSIAADTTVNSYAYFNGGAPENSYIYIATDKGYQKAALDAGSIPTSISNPNSATNAESSFGTLNLSSIWIFKAKTYVSLIEKTTASKNGLWSRPYPGSNWNRD